MNSLIFLRIIYAYCTTIVDELQNSSCLALCRFQAYTKSNIIKNQVISEQLCAKQAHKIWCKNVHGLLRTIHFRCGTFLSAPCIQSAQHRNYHAYNSTLLLHLWWHHLSRCTVLSWSICIGKLYTSAKINIEMLYTNYNNQKNGACNVNTCKDNSKKNDYFTINYCCHACLSSLSVSGAMVLFIACAVCWPLCGPFVIVIVWLNGRDARQTTCV